MFHQAILLLLLLIVAVEAATAPKLHPLVLTWIREQNQLPASAAVSSSSGLVVLNDRYVLERPIQLSPQLQQLGSLSTTTVNACPASSSFIDYYPVSPYTSETALLHPASSLQFPPLVTPQSTLHDRYNLDNRLGRGGSGEVWFARDAFDRDRVYVLKRIFAPKLPSGLRETRFGQLLRGQPGFTRYIEAFSRESSVTGESELWLVFEHEGTSLHHFLYDNSHGDGVVQRSLFWRRLRETKGAGAHLRREIARQLVLSLANLTQLGVVHRDVKPANVLIQVEEHSVRLGDFGSAVLLLHTEKDVNGGGGYTRRDHTLQYEPPEFQLEEEEEGKDTPLALSRFHASFDAWSLGVLLLEMLLGTDRVFELSPAQQRELAKRRRGHRTSGGGQRPALSSSSTTGAAATGQSSLLLDSLREFGLDDKARFNASIKRLDEVYGRGFYDEDDDDDDQNHQASHHELDFCFQLLRLDPSKRLTMTEALAHPYLHRSTPATSAGVQHTGDDRGIAAVGGVSTATSMEPTASSFACHTCGRMFSTYDGCQAHSTARRHHMAGSGGVQCAAHPRPTAAALLRSSVCEPETLLTRLSSPAAQAVWCGNRGSKAYSEDFFHCSADMRVLAVADGHLGQAAARFVLPELVRNLSSSAAAAASAVSGSHHHYLADLFQRTNDRLLLRSVKDTSGAAVTVAVLAPDGQSVTVANVGDVRALFCCEEEDRLVVLTPHDHLAESERGRINALPGGFVEFRNGRHRVQGVLALGRAFGDRGLRPYVSIEPSVTVYRFPTLPRRRRFLVLATDGLTDAMSDEDVMRVCVDEEEDNSNSGLPWYTRAATRLVWEAQQRGLTGDNVGVAVVPV